MAKLHALLRPPRAFDEKRTMKAYEFSHTVEGLKKGVGLSKDAVAYESVLRESVKAALRSVLTESSEVDPYVADVHAAAKTGLLAAIPDAKFGSCSNRRLNVMTSFERILQIMRMTCKTVFEYDAIRAELKQVRTMSEGQTKGQLVPLLSGEANGLPVLQSIARTRNAVGQDIYKFKTLFAIAQKLELNVGDTIRGIYDLD